MPSDLCSLLFAAFNAWSDTFGLLLIIDSNSIPKLNNLQCTRYANATKLTSWTLLDFLITLGKNIGHSGHFSMDLVQIDFLHCKKAATQKKCNQYEIFFLFDVFVFH